MQLSERILSSEGVQIGGKTALIISIFGGLINIFTKMEIVNPILVTVSSILGIAFVWYKLKMIHHDYIVKKEARKKAGLPEIKFRFPWTKK